MSDVTYFKYNNTVYYICVILDLFARKVIGYRISLSNSTQLTKGTFITAYKERQPQDLMFHSDQGTNYTSATFRLCLKDLNAKQSFSNPGNPFNNSVMESFFKSMKTEKLYRTDFRSEREFRVSVKEYIEFYNEKRRIPYSVIGHRTSAKRNTSGSKPLYKILNCTRMVRFEIILEIRFAVWNVCKIVSDKPKPRKPV